MSSAGVFKIIMQSPLYTDFPDLTRDMLVELGGAMALKEARRLCGHNAVESLRWERPILTGSVREKNHARKVRLNLRSMVFTENFCSCDTGRRGYVCSHALALCLEVERRREKALKEPTSQSGETEEAGPDQSPSPEIKDIQSLRIDPEGTPLNLWILLPPSMENAATRPSIPLKLEFETEGARVAPEKLFKGQAYAVSRELYGVLAQLESLGGGQLCSLIQLKPPVLKAMLEALGNRAKVAHVNEPAKPYPVDNGLIAEVIRHLQPPATKGRLKKTWSGEKRYRRETVNSSNGPYLEAHTPGDRKRGSGSGNQDTENGVKIDGSEHFLSFAFSNSKDPDSRKWVETIREYGFRCEPSNGRYWLRDRHSTLNFLARHWEVLHHDSAIRFTPNFRQRTAHIKAAKFEIHAADSSGGFDLTMQLQLGDATAGDIQRAILSNRHYLQSGNTLYLLNSEHLERACALQQKLTGQRDRVLTTEFKTTLKSTLLPVAAEFLEEYDPNFQIPEIWNKRSGALRQISQLQPAPAGAEAEAILRPYQRTGLAWLWHLYNNGLGGILADEMGLGKTLQALALIQAAITTGQPGQREGSSSNGLTRNGQRTEAAQDHSPSIALVVCPASLVENWSREAGKFTPGLNIFRHHGFKRLENPEEAEPYDLVITSYGTLVRDQALLQAIPFSLIIADEAQHVKNRRTQASKALRSLAARGRFILTGTPIENSVEDLRSLFSYLMPGYLDALPKGMKREEKIWYDRHHLQRVAPYILRRTKAVVAPELPDRIEQTIHCEMPPAQRAFYDKVRQDTEKQIFEMEMAGASENKIKFAALTQLLRLRQICADPRILDPDFKAAHSTKLTALREILDEAMDDNHRILLFSQFTSVLKLLKKTLISQEIPFCYLDGSTRRRQEVCDQFNSNGQIPIFLISLKAGGVGLNLTGADTVIHFDPWWNPAVEAQATDRAHRIGQTKTVNSLKFIAVGTVEEKVLDIQKNKAELLRDLFRASDASSAKVSLSDLKSLLKE